MQYVVPYLNFDKIIKSVFFPDLFDNVTNDNDNDNIETNKLEPYKPFYEDGKLFIKLINFEDSNSYYNPNPNDVTIIGDKAMLRGDNMAHGDYSLYMERYNKLKEIIENAIKSLYFMGAIPLNFSNQVNQEILYNWKLKPLVSFNGINESASLFFPDWEDLRLTIYDGKFNLLKRQLNYYNKQCDYKIVFIQIAGYPEINDVEQIIFDLYQLFNINEFYVDNEFIGMEIENKEKASKIADIISSHNFKKLKYKKLTKKPLTNNIDNNIKYMNSKFNGLMYKDLVTGDYFLLNLE